jgi:hypothetical protein
MAKVPDLGSDFSQKLLKDLRRRRERLGFESDAEQRAAPRGKFLFSPRRRLAVAVCFVPPMCSSIF